MKYWSPKFLLFLVLSTTWFVLYWALSVPDNPGWYMFVLGAPMCMELAIHVRHLGNLFQFSTKWASQICGQIEYTRPLILRRSSVNMLGFSILFAVLFAFTGSRFVAGGMFSCFLLSAKHWYLARRAAAKRAASVEPALAKSSGA
jgi:hypothetical protein